MKKQLLLFCSALLLSAGSSYSQCMPDFNLTTPGVYPDTITNLDTGMVGQVYSDTIQFKVYSTVSVLTVDSIRILNINGLPSGISTSSNPPGMVFAGGSNGCVLVDGNPTTAGTNPLIIALRVFGHVGPAPAQIDTNVYGYKIVVLPPNGIPPMTGLTFNVLQNIPNPVDASTEISFTVPTAGRVDLRVVDLLGKELVSRKIEAVAGLNKTPLIPKYLKAGIYFYSVTYRSKTITRKMIVAARP